MLTGFSLRVIMLKNGIERFFMKKLLISLLVITFALFFVGCSSTVSPDSYTQGSAWIEVQEITYSLNNSSDIKYSNSQINNLGIILQPNLKVRFLSDGSIEIKYSETPVNPKENIGYSNICRNFTKRILPISYSITYLSE